MKIPRRITRQALFDRALDAVRFTKNYRPGHKLTKLVHRNERARCDDELVADLARAGRSTVEHTTPRTACALYDIRTDARPRGLVPDLHELERQDARGLAVLGVELDRA